MRVAYFINQYPAVSHTFIRREIRALESLGATVVRYALRSSAGNLVDAEDIAEQQQTQYILKAGIGTFLRSLFAAVTRRPGAIISIVWLATKMGRQSDRG